MKAVIAGVSIPDFRIGRRIRFRSGGHEWFGIITMHGEESKRDYTVIAGRLVYDNAVPNDKVMPLAAGGRPERQLVLPMAWFREHPDAIVAMYEEPENVAMAFEYHCNGRLLYEKPAPKKMTVAQICEALGYEVEIVRDDDA